MAICPYAALAGNDSVVRELMSPSRCSIVRWRPLNRYAAMLLRGYMTTTETPRLNNGAERCIYHTLLDQPQPDDLVVANQRVTDHLKDHEVDFVVAIEGAGIACLEVKGGEVWHDGDGWCQYRGGKQVRIEPIRQAREACYALRNYVESDPRWTQGRLRWDHFVVLPNTELPKDFSLPECPRWKIFDRTDLPSLAHQLRHILIRQELDRPLLTQDGIGG